VQGGGRVKVVVRGVTLEDIREGEEVDSEEVDSEEVDSEEVDSEEVDSEEVNSEEVNTTTIVVESNSSQLKWASL
jgi:hypothetical protein